MDRDGFSLVVDDSHILSHPPYIKLYSWGYEYDEVLLCSFVVDHLLTGATSCVL